MSLTTGSEIGDFSDISKITEPEFPKLVAPQAEPRKHDIIYSHVINYIIVHSSALYGLYLTFTVAKWSSFIFFFILLILSNFGTTAGVHRLWTHRAYKAKIQLEIILIILASLANQQTVAKWVRDHRLHHKYSDTDADPYNATRGFFFSHMGWLLVRKHPEILKRGKYINMTDIHANPVLAFQTKYAVPMITTICFVLPTVIPMYFFGETFKTAFFMTIARYLTNLHFTFLVNSAAHMFGTRPYDKNIKPVQNKFVSFLIFGEGFHNYHHVFPSDYRTAELGNNALNWAALFIDFFAWIGWAYDLKTAPNELILSRSQRTGDGTKILYQPSLG